MRPADNQPGKNVYECLECGKRVENPETKVCESCGASLRNLGQPRDL